jgi:hypothetical protein
MLSADDWAAYELAKADIEATAESPQEYEERLRALAEEMGL